MEANNMATPERGGQTYQAAAVKTETRPVRKIEIPPAPPRKGLLKRLRQALFFAATRVIPSAVLLGGGGLAAQHHVQEQEKLNPSGITADIQGIPSTAEKDLDALAKKLGLNVHLEPKVAPYNPDSTKEQIIKAGPNGNARPMTREEVRDFINRIPPIFEPPKPGEQAPKVEMILSVNPENAKQISIIRDPLLIRDTNGNELYTYDYLKMNVRGNTPFTIPIYAGAKKMDAKTFVNAGGIALLELRYYFNNGQVIHGRIVFTDNNFTPTDTMDSIPKYESRSIDSTDKVEAAPAKEFNLEDNPHVELFYPKGSTTVFLGLDNGNPFGLSPTLKDSKGTTSYINW